MPERELMIRERSTLPLKVLLRARLQQSDARLHRATQRLRDAARALTPAAQVADRPMQWILAGFVVGLALGWLGAPSHPRRMQ